VIDPLGEFCLHLDLSGDALSASEQQLLYIQRNLKEPKLIGFYHRSCWV
jgi:hypothetical protein